MTSLFPPASEYRSDHVGLSRRRRWLVVDFDGTCTEMDTTPLLPHLAAFVSRRRSSIDSTHASSDVDAMHRHDLDRRLALFRRLEDVYAKLYDDAKSSLLISIDGTSGGDSDRRSIHDILDALDEPSTLVTGMVSESRVLAGLGDITARELEGALRLYGISTSNDDADSSDDADLGRIEENTKTLIDDDNDSDGAGELFRKVVIRLRRGCEDTLARILSENEENDSCCNDGDSPPCLGWSLAVLSINWCPALIDASLVQPVLNRRRNSLGVHSFMREIPIWSNQVNGEGEVKLHIPGASAKRDRIIELRRHLHMTSDSSSLIVYVGDSPTDISALLEADIGILIGNSNSAKLIAARWSVQVVPLQKRDQYGFGRTVDGNLGNWPKNLLWHAESWYEIDDMMIQLDELWS
ncbi:hypothetical protein ACHAXA_005983 [Cyclostephanos tholiformis]|uniref:Uncharacterized protein n=1 Tax=Cyclostephanos tholiformis TaxID=382380 RepID=A0ABD3SRT2_9STRA